MKIRNDKISSNYLNYVKNKIYALNKSSLRSHKIPQNKHEETRSSPKYTEPLRGSFNDRNSFL
jgi:hypothetical protein